MLKHRVGRQEQRLHLCELAIDQGHAQLRLVIAVLPQALDDDGGTDLLAVVGDQAGRGRDLDIGEYVVVERLTNDIHSRMRREHRGLSGVHGHDHVHFVKKTGAPLNDIQMSRGHGVIRSWAYCDSHMHSLPRIAGQSVYERAGAQTPDMQR